MTKADIIDKVAAGTGLTKLETEAVVNGFITVIKEALADEERIEIRGFGTFKVQQRAPRTARNLKTNEKVVVDECFVPVFKPSRRLKELVMAEVQARHHTT